MKMSIKRLLQLTTEFLIISVISVFCESCENSFKIFQEMSQRCQQPGRLDPRASMKLFHQKVFTQMECLDICLRTAECGSYDVKQKHLENPRKPFWICVINRRVNSQALTPKLGRKQKGWTHFPVSSQDLQKVSYYRYQKVHSDKQERNPFFSGLFSSASFICLILVERNKNTF